MKTSNTKPTAATRKNPPLAAIIVGLIAVVGLVWGGMALFSALNKSTANYAEEVAKPLEEGLVKAGGVKKCGSGDAGRGSDNVQPHYGVTYELPLSREQAIATINKVSSENGYSLSHASVTNRGSVPVADQYLDNWFYDTAGRMSPYKDLQPGKIDLFFVVNNDGPIELSEISCKTDKPVKVNSDANTSAVNIQVDLPAFRR